MSANPLKALRISVIALLVLLFVQYEFGMAVNIANPPSLPAFSISDSNAFNTGAMDPCPCSNNQNPL